MHTIRSQAYKFIAVVGLLATLSGCASLGGSNNYACTGLPSDDKERGCMSVRDVYDATQDHYTSAPSGNPPSQRGSAHPASDTGRTQALSASSDEALPASRGVDPLDVAANYVAPRLPDQPVPVRTPAQVMRVWIAPWENMDGDLVTTGYLYTEIEPRRWVLGDSPETESQRSLSPLK